MIHFVEATVGYFLQTKFVAQLDIPEKDRRTMERISPTAFSGLISTLVCVQYSIDGDQISGFLPLSGEIVQRSYSYYLEEEMRELFSIYCVRDTAFLASILAVFPEKYLEKEKKYYCVIHNKGQPEYLLQFSTSIQPVASEQTFCAWPSCHVKTSSIYCTYHSTTLGKKDSKANTQDQLTSWTSLRENLAIEKLLTGETASMVDSVYKEAKSNSFSLWLQ